MQQAVSSVAKKRCFKVHVFLKSLKKSRNEKQEILDKPKDSKNEKKLDIYKKEKKTNFVASMNSIGKIVW